MDNSIETTAGISIVGVPAMVAAGLREAIFAGRLAGGALLRQEGIGQLATCVIKAAAESILLAVAVADVSLEDRIAAEIVFPRIDTQI